MPQCQFLFSAIFVFRKVTQEIFSELDETKLEVSIFPDTRRSPKQRRRRARRWPHHLVAWVHPWPHHPVVWGPWVPSDIAPPLIKSLRRKNPKGIGVSPRKVSQLRCHRRRSLGDRSLCSGTLSGRGISPGAISITVVVSYDEEGVVLSWG
jgi:hypothetical protein